MITIECDTANIDWLDIVYMPKSSHSLWYLRYGTVRRSFVAIVLDQQKTRYSEDPRLKLQQKIKFNNCLNLRVIKPQKKTVVYVFKPVLHYFKRTSLYCESNGVRSGSRAISSHWTGHQKCSSMCHSVVCLQKIQTLLVHTRGNFALGLYLALIFFQSTYLNKVLCKQRHFAIEAP